MGSLTLVLSVYMPASVHDVALGQFADSMMGVPVPAFAGSFRATARPKWGAAARATTDPLAGPVRRANMHVAAARVPAKARLRWRRRPGGDLCSLLRPNLVIGPPGIRGLIAAKQTTDIKAG
jgi:hypothetical protein